MIYKKYCIDYEDNIEYNDIKIENNIIKCQDISYNLYKLYLWQKLLVNELLDKYKEVVLEIEYIDIDYIKRLIIKSKFTIPKTRHISNQCLVCSKRINCNEFQEALIKDYVLSIDTPEKLYNTYITIGAKIEVLENLKDELRAKIDEMIVKNNGKLVLGQLGLSLTHKEIMKDDFPIDIALKNNLLNANNCKIKIKEFKETIKGTEFEKYLSKVKWQKRLVIE